MSNNFATDKHLPDIVVNSGSMEVNNFDSDLRNKGQEPIRKRQGRKREVSVKRRAA